MRRLASTWSHGERSLSFSDAEGSFGKLLVNARTGWVRPSHTLLRRLVGVSDGLDIITCEDAAAWEAWLAANHRLHQGVWLKIAKKDTGVPSVTNDDAVNVGLCWGWISGHRKALDETYFLQRYTPRRPGSNWSAVNIAKVDALIGAGRMQPPGLSEVDAAKTDGRWARALGS